MIVTLTLDKINIADDNIYCSFSEETLRKHYSGNSRQRPRKTYKLYLNNRELQLECPVIQNTRQEAIVIWPAIKLPYRKYPVYVYLYGVALYLSSNLSMRQAAAQVRKTFGLDKFSHSTICRTLKKLSEITEDLAKIMTGDMSEYTGGCTINALEPRKNWDSTRQDKYHRLLTILYPVLNKAHIVEYASLLNYQYFNLFKKFII